jgi:hypothetical protein
VRGERAAREEKGNLLYLEQRFSGIAAQTLHHKNIIDSLPAQITALKDNAKCGPDEWKHGAVMPCPKTSEISQV